MTPPQNVTSLPLDRRTIADQLKAAGYATAMFGKWHVGAQAKFHPSKRGFDEAIVTGMARHFDFGTDPETPYAEGAYLADFITDKAVDFIDRHRDQPFFLYLPHFAVHVPYQAKKELISKFRGKPPAGGHGDPTYAAMIASIDESVGRILDKLDELKLGDNTVVIFSSDNGGVGGAQSVG
jgi:arylsulfatase A-like enzyme